MAWASTRPRQTSTLAQICRPVLALLAENALKPCPHDASAVFATRASARSRLRRAARQYRRACEGWVANVRVLDMLMSTKAESVVVFGDLLFATTC